MKQIFDWLREQMRKEIVCTHATPIKAEHARITAYENTIKLVDEAEAKWESECCEWKFEKNTGLVWHCENEIESYNISYQRELKTFLEEFECKCRHCGKPIKISEVE